MILTLAISLAAFCGVMRLQAWRWRLLAPAYASAVRRPAKAVKRLESLVSLGGGWGYSLYAGVRIEVGEEGLSLRLIPPFSMFAPPLFLPFSEMKVRRTDWYLNTGSFAVTMDRANGVDLVIREELLSWIRANTDRM